MDRPNLGDELMRQPGADGPKNLVTDAAQLLRRARRRTRVLAATMLSLWVLTGGGVIAWAVGFALFFAPWMAYAAGQVAYQTEIQAAKTQQQASSSAPAEEQPETQPPNSDRSVSSRPETHDSYARRVHRRSSDPDFMRAQTGMSIRALGLYVYYGGIVSGVLLVLSAASTIGFIYASRQTTLQQIQMSLKEIVDEIKHAH